MALFVALASGAYASGLIAGSQIKNHSIPATKLTASAIKALRGNRGPVGKPGPFPPTLPSGKTVRGIFAAAGEASGADTSDIADNISFGWTLTARPTPHFIQAGAAVPAGCSGTPDDPGADPGNLCVFEVVHTNVDDAHTYVWNPVFNSTGMAEPFGAAVLSSSAGAGYYDFGGSWAVTAP
jgi:hypothetical protein